MPCHHTGIDIAEQAQALQGGLLRGEISKTDLPRAQHIHRLRGIANRAQLDDVDVRGIFSPETVIAIKRDDSSPPVHAFHEVAPSRGGDPVGQH